VQFRTLLFHTDYPHLFRAPDYIIRNKEKTVYISSFSRDYEKGKENELEVFPIIKKFFADDIKHNKATFAKHDFESDTCHYEPKSRDCSIAQFPAAIVGQNKFECLKKLILPFRYDDGLFARADCNAKFDDVFLINTTLLTKIEL
jgi:hypothetical protein